MTDARRFKPWTVEQRQTAKRRMHKAQLDVLRKSTNAAFIHSFMIVPDETGHMHFITSHTGTLQPRTEDIPSFLRMLADSYEKADAGMEGFTQ